MTKEKTIKPEVISYLTLRRAIGILGIALPIILVVGSVIVCNCFEIQVSISNYYHTCMRNIFVGVLCCVGLFLFSYRGYELKDDIAGHLGGIFAFGVAWLPTTFKGDATCLITPIYENPLTGILHLISATLFFGVLIYFSLFLFTKSATKESSLTTKKKRTQKENRNLVYKICGYTMLGCIVLIGIYIALFKGKYTWLDNTNVVFWGEAIALWAFGVSWLTKGEVLWRDAIKEFDS